MRQSAGVMGHCKLSNFKHQISGFQVSGVRCQGRKPKTLKPETSVFVIWNFYSSSTPKPLVICFALCSMRLALFFNGQLTTDNGQFGEKYSYHKSSFMLTLSLDQS
jgi:hypothetical protein